jgi:hypothetical protein
MPSEPMEIPGGIRACRSLSAPVAGREAVFEVKPSVASTIPSFFTRDFDTVEP